MDELAHGHIAVNQSKNVVLAKAAREDAQFDTKPHRRNAQIRLNVFCDASHNAIATPVKCKRENYVNLLK
jgi:hypothetical protein